MKIFLFFESDSLWYQELYQSVKSAFEEAGCTVIGSTTLLEPNKLIQLIDKEQPDFVFEHNRTKDEVPNFPKDVKHISWIIDFRGRDYAQLSGSDILYVWAQDWVQRFENAGVCNVKFLPPATNAEIYQPLKDVQPQYDLVFLGHISKEWTQRELNRFIGFRKGQKYYFKDILPLVQEYVLTKDVKVPIFEYLESMGVEFKQPIEQTVTYDIVSRIFRQTRREHFIDTSLQVSNKLIIYGSENWKLYSKYQNFYAHYIQSPTKLNRAMQQARVLLHDGNYPHFRTFDAMASGVAVAAAVPPHNFDDPWGKLGFNHLEHYCAVDTFTAQPDLSVLHNTKRLKEIANNAREKVLNEHLWIHRALKVLQDFKNLKN